jgi:hypothetical protein
MWFPLNSGAKYNTQKEVAMAARLHGVQKAAWWKNSPEKLRPL